MTKWIRDITTAPPPSRRKSVEDRVIDLLLEHRAVEYVKLHEGRDWDDLTNIEKRKAIEAAKERAWEQFEISVSKNKKLLKRLKDK